MFKLAGLFVEIKAMDAPFKASIAALQSTAGAMARGIGSAFGGAFHGATAGIGAATRAIGGLFGAIAQGTDLTDKADESIASVAGSMFEAFAEAPGPVGIALAAVTGLMSALDEGNEDVAQLGAYWTEAMAPVKETLEGALHSLTGWIAGLRETILTSDGAKGAIEQVGIYASAAFENAKIAIDQGIAVFSQFHAVAEDLFQSAQIWFEGFQADVQATFGGPGVASVASWGAAIQTWVLDKVELVGIFVRNWPDFFQIAGLKITEVMMNIGEYMSTVPANAKLIGEYIAGNWVQLFVDAGNAIGTVFSNLATNLKNIWQAFLDYMKTGKFDVNFTPLLEGFKATAGKLPDMVKPALTDLGDQLKAIEDRIGSRTFEAHAKKDAATKAAAKAAVDDAGGGKFKSESFGAAEFANRIRASIMSGGQGDDKKESLDAAKRTAKAVEKLAADSDKPRVARAG